MNMLEYGVAVSGAAGEIHILGYDNSVQRMRICDIIVMKDG